MSDQSAVGGGVMQIRRAGGEWYAPKRDLGQSFHKFISATLHRMPNFKFTFGGLSDTEVGENARRLARLLNRVRDGNLTIEETRDLYWEMHPVFRSSFSEMFFVSLLGGYLQFWLEELAPKQVGDAPIPWEGVEKGIHDFITAVVGDKELNSGDDAAPGVSNISK